jgi:hypothetical protein
MSDCAFYLQVNSCYGNVCTVHGGERCVILQDIQEIHDQNDDYSLTEVLGIGLATTDMRQVGSRSHGHVTNELFMRSSSRLTFMTTVIILKILRRGLSIAIGGFLVYLAIRATLSTLSFVRRILPSCSQPFWSRINAPL